MTIHVRSPSTQAGVDNTITRLTRTFFVWNYIEVDYEVSTEAVNDLLRIYVNGVLGDSASGTASGTFTIDTSADFFTFVPIRIEYSKNGSVSSGSDVVKVTEIRFYSTGPTTLEDTYTFIADQGAPPTGWTEVLNAGGVAVVGSHWATGSDSINGVIGATTTMPTAALAGKQTHLGVIAATTTRPTCAIAGRQPEFEVASFLLKNNGRHIAALEPSHHTAALEPSRHTAALSEG